jgi:hypothetical protein
VESISPPSDAAVHKLDQQLESFTFVSFSYSLLAFRLLAFESLFKFSDGQNGGSRSQPIGIATPLDKL